MLVTTGTHFLDRMLWWFGMPRSCELADDSLGGPEANAVARFRFERDGASFEGSARFSKTVRLPAGFVMDTERGRVLLREGDGELIQLRAADHPTVESLLREADRADDGLDMFARQLQDFATAIRTGRDPLVGVSQGIECARLVEPLYADRQPLDQRG